MHESLPLLHLYIFMVWCLGSDATVVILYKLFCALSLVMVLFSKFPSAIDILYTISDLFSFSVSKGIQ